MLKRRRPAIDTRIAPVQGVTRDGQPLSYNRAPAPDLGPWIARLYCTIVEAPAENLIECGLFNDAAAIRIQLGGEWNAQTADGPRQFGKASLFFGPQTRRMPVSVRGGFASIGVSLRPGACHALGGHNLAEHLDRLATTDVFGLPSEAVLAALDPDASPEEWLRTLEDLLRREVDRAKGRKPDPVTAKFEVAAFSDPTIEVSEFARLNAIEQRRLERLIRRDFGMAPKQVLRRARALDMASHLRGVADQDEGDELALRYYDQSHLIRDFVELFGMTPTQFVEKPQPILTLALESRQARRLEALSRLKPGAPKPWEPLYQKAASRTAS